MLHAVVVSVWCGMLVVNKSSVDEDRILGSSTPHFYVVTVAARSVVLRPLIHTYRHTAEWGSNSYFAYDIVTLVRDKPQGYAFLVHAFMSFIVYILTTVSLLFSTIEDEWRINGS